SSIGNTTEVDAFNPNTRTWSTVASLPTFRGYLTATTANDGTIYAIGGYGDSGYSNEVDAYNPATNSWSSTVNSLPIPLAQAPATTGTDGPIYLIGGFSNTGSNNGVYAFTPLPRGLSLNSSNGVISGTPTLAGRYRVTITATDAAGVN